MNDIQSLFNQISTVIYLLDCAILADVLNQFDEIVRSVSIVRVGDRSRLVSQCDNIVSTLLIFGFVGFGFVLVSDRLKMKFIYFVYRLLIHYFFKDESFLDCFWIEFRLLKNFPDPFIFWFCPYHVLKYVFQCDPTASVDDGLGMQSSINFNNTNPRCFNLIFFSKYWYWWKRCEYLFNCPSSIRSETCSDGVLIKNSVKEMSEIVIKDTICMCRIVFLTQLLFVNLHKLEVILRIAWIDEIKNWLDNTTHCWPFAYHDVLWNRIPRIFGSISLDEWSLSYFVRTCVQIAYRVPCHIVFLLWAYKVFHLSRNCFVLSSKSIRSIDLSISQINMIKTKGMIKIVSNDLFLWPRKMNQWSQESD